MAVRFIFMPRGYGKNKYLYSLSEKNLLELIKLKANQITISNSIPFIENTIKEIDDLLSIIRIKNK